MEKNKETYTPAAFSLRLAQLREAKKVSARAMSHYLGHNKNYINQIESQKFLPSLTEFFEICSYLCVSPSDFFNTEIKNPNEVDGIAELCRKLTSEQADSVYHMLKSFTR